MMAAAGSLFKSLERIPDPRQPRGVRHPFQAILRLTLLGPVSGQTTMAHIAWFGELHWPELRDPLGFDRDRAPHAAAISRTLSGVPFVQPQEALPDWMMGAVPDRELAAAVDGQWAKQSQDAAGQPPAMVNVLAHEPKLCLAQWPLTEKRYEPQGYCGSNRPDYLSVIQDCSC